jgi:hypothetical protein
MRSFSSFSNSTATGVQSADGTGVFVGKTNSSNALGHVGPSNYSISSPPYVVKSCDQVLLVPVKRILDLNDYSKREDGFLTMSIYMINLFEQKDSNKLIESISMNKLRNIPSPLTGAPGCINFKGSSKKIGICVENNTLVQELIKANEDFKKCAKGQSLTKGHEILSECNAHNNNSTATQSSTGVNKNSNINPYYSDLKVPGS